MADLIRLNTPRWKGEYPLPIDDDPINALEWRWIKRISGYMPLTLLDGFRGGDPDVFIALAVIALHRAGKISRDEALEAAAVFDELPPESSITVIAGQPEEAEEGDASPPEPQPGTEPPLRSIGGSSSSTSEQNPAVDLSRTGALA